MPPITEQTHLDFIDDHIRPLEELKRQMGIRAASAALAFTNIGGATAHDDADTIENRPDAGVVTWAEIKTSIGSLALVKAEYDTHADLTENLSIRPPTVN